MFAEKFEGEHVLFMMGRFIVRIQITLTKEDVQILD